MITKLCKQETSEILDILGGLNHLILLKMTFKI